MVDGRLEEDSRWGIWVIRRELEGELEGETSIGGSVGAGDGSGPVEEVLWIVREGGDAGGGGHHQLHELCL